MSIILGSIGILGIGGLIALFIFAPAAAAVLMQMVEAILSALLKTRIGCAMMAATVTFLVTALWISHVDRVACTMRINDLNAKAEVARVQRDAEIARVTKADAEIRIVDLQKQLDDTTTLVNNYEDQLRAKPVAACIVGDDADKLRGIAGQPKTASQHPRRLRTHRQHGPGAAHQP